MTVWSRAFISTKLGRVKITRIARVHGGNRACAPTPRTDLVESPGHEMMLLTLIWAGTALFAGNELIHFLVDEDLPEPQQEPTTEAEPATEPEDSEPEDSEPAEPEEPFGSIASTNRALAISGSSLALLGAGVVSPVLGVLGVSVLAIGAIPSARRSWRNLVETKRLDYEGLVVVDVALCIAVGVPALAALGWAVYGLGLRMIHATRNRTRGEFDSAFSQMSDRAWRQGEDGVEIEVALADIEVGDLLVVRAGDAVPVDGCVVEGVVGVDQRALTGESRLREFSDGDEVLAATIVLSGEGIIRAERTGQATIAARVNALLLETVSFEQRLTTRAVNETERSVRPTMATALVGASQRGLGGALSGVWTNSVDTTFLASPFSMINTIQAAARGSILIKDGRSLEQLVSIDTVVFDKTGTLTLDEFEVAAVHCHGVLDEDQIFALAAALEERQKHPIARAVTEEAQRRGIAAAQVETRTTELGYGLRATYSGERVLLGSARLMAREGIELPQAIADAAARLETAGRSLIHLAVGQRHEGMIELVPHVRPEAARLIEVLHARGLDTMIVTGDDEGPTAALASELGVSRYIARTLPETKAEIVEQLQAEGRRVCFVGDGINDALALKGANVSISMSGASPLAIESAQVLLRTGSLEQIEMLFEIADNFEKEQHVIISSGRVVTTTSAMALIFLGARLPILLGVYAGSFGLSLGMAMLPRLREPS